MGGLLLVLLNRQGWIVVGLVLRMGFADFRTASSFQVQFSRSFSHTQILSQVHTHTHTRTHAHTHTHRYYMYMYMYMYMFVTAYMCVTAWPNGYGVWLRIRRLWVRVPSWSLLLLAFSFDDTKTMKTGHFTLILTHAHWTSKPFQQTGTVPSSPCAKSEKPLFFRSPCTPRPTSIFLHQHVHKGKRSKNLLVGTKTTPPKLTKEADFRSDSPPSIALQYWCDKRAECQSTRSAKASHLNAVCEPWPHASRKLWCRIADENRTKVRSMCPSWVFIPPEGPARWPKFSYSLFILNAIMKKRSRLFMISSQTVGNCVLVKFWCC